MVSPQNNWLLFALLLHQNPSISHEKRTHMFQNLIPGSPLDHRSLLSVKDMQSVRNKGMKDRKNYHEEWIVMIVEWNLIASYTYTNYVNKIASRNL